MKLSDREKLKAPEMFFPCFDLTFLQADTIMALLYNVCFTTCLEMRPLLRQKG